MPLVKRRQAASRAASAPRLDAADPAERRAAALGGGVGVEALLAALATEPAREVRAAIVTALIATGGEAVAQGLVARLGSEDAALRNDAIDALRRLGEAAAAPLGAALRQPDPDVRLFAVNALDQGRAPWARAHLRAVLAEEPEVTVGLAAVEALAETGLPEDASALRAFAERFPQEPMVAFAVGVALDQIGVTGQ